MSGWQELLTVFQDMDVESASFSAVYYNLLMWAPLEESMRISRIYTQKIIEYYSKRHRVFREECICGIVVPVEVTSEQV